MLKVRNSPKNFLPVKEQGNTGIPACGNTETDKNVCATFKCKDTDRNVCATLKQYVIEVVTEPPGLLFNYIFGNC